MFSMSHLKAAGLTIGILFALGVFAPQIRARITGA